MRCWQGRDVKWKIVCFLEHSQICARSSPLQDVVDTANSNTFSKEGELCLRVLAELDDFVHCSDDIRLAQQLVRDELPDPTATPSVMLPAVTADVLAKLRTSPILYSGGAASTSFT